MTSVYVIAAEGGPVKVGIAGKPRRRLSTLRTASAVRLRMIYAAEVIGDARMVERRAHELLIDGRLSGEWFNVPQDEAVSAIASAAAELGCLLKSENVMRITFDPTKRDAALTERGLDFADAAEVFAGPTADLPDTRFAYPEPRTISFGHRRGQLVAVMWTPAEGGRQVISMRKANDREKRRYG